MAKVNPAQFVREVRAEFGKVHWPTRKETMISTGMVVFLAALASIFFLLVDMAAGSLVALILGLR